MNVIYLFPAMIERNNSSVFVYLNYRDQKIIIPEPDGIDDIEQFKMEVAAKVFHKTIIEQPPMPKQVHESIDIKTPFFEEDEE